MTSLTRRVEPGNILISDEQSRIRIQVDAALDYVGGIAFELAGIAWAEIHYFVQPDAENRIARRFHVQFEHFLPDNAHTYNYALPATIRIGDHLWMHNPGSYRVQDVFDQRPDSDMAAGYTFLRHKGYGLPEAVFYRRFLRAIGEDRRAEIIMVYSEDAATVEAHKTPFIEGSQPEDAETALHDALLGRALRTFRIIEG